MTAFQIKRFALPIILTVALSGCVSDSSVAPKVTGFASALNNTTDGVKKAFNITEDFNQKAQIDDLVSQYAKGELPSKPDAKPLFPDKALEARLLALNGLDAYGKILADIVSGTTKSELTDADQKLAENLKALTDASFKVAGSNFKNSDVLAAGMATAANAIGDLIIDHKIATELPPIINRMHPNIEKVAKLLDADIGKPGDSGLRNIIKIKARDITLSRDSIIRSYIPINICDNHSNANAQKCATVKHGLTLTELRSEVNGFFDITSEADTTLATIQESLRSLVNAHKALADVANTKNVSADVAIKQFVKEASAINDCYQKLLTRLKKSGG